MRVKLVTGFRKDQVFSIPAEEAHKAYYLFLNPDARTVFSTGLALKGSEVQRIEPDYQGTMGWNESHALDADDYNELHEKGVMRRLAQALNAAKEIAAHATPQDLALPLSKLVIKYPQLAPGVERRDGEMKRIGELNV